MMTLFNRKKAARRNIKDERSFILNSETNFLVSEAYNTLRSNLMFSLVGKGCKVVEFTSSEASEGKSINTLNTAITFAQTNARVLIIDCDLRRANINRLLNKNASPGVTDVLINTCDVKKAIVHDIEHNIDALFAGSTPPNPSELISSNEFKDLIERLRNDYDYIFIDTPPVGAVIDAAIVSKYTDGTVIVVRTGEAKKDEVVNVVNQLEFAGAKIVGFVLNGIELEYKSKYKKYKSSYESDDREDFVPEKKKSKTKKKK